ncbi:3-oxo-tetronate kinase [Streptomyces sp. NPDC002790]|uniref:3-oxo-tetronate kinase n=1 Tax=Streptomyces sp. NPDC002790 TaxID=3154431 RepID=UPI00332A3554
MPLLGAIADDFTGATDLATMLVARGFRTVVAVGSAGLTGDGPAAAEVQRADAVVVALKTRTVPVDEAVRESTTALRALQAAGCNRFYFKYCSTFDSTPEGNIGPVSEALLDALGESATVVVPAFPATGRTVYKSRLFVLDELLDESPMRDHPLTPMRDSHLGRLLAPQTARPVQSVDLDTVRSGAQALRDALAAPQFTDSLTVIDATNDDDLRTIAAATSDMRLVTGAAGLALGLAGPHEGTARATAASASGAPGAVLAGSASAATRAQVAHAQQHLPHRKLDIAALRSDPAAAVAELVDFARACWHRDATLPPLIYAVASLADLEHDTPLGATPASELVEQALAACATALVHAGARRLLVAGGETSGAVTTALKARTLRIGQQIAPGVAWARTQPCAGGASDGIDLALKSGNFGGTDIFTTAWDHLA